MLRALVVALLLANLAFFGWTQGWLDGVVGARPGGDREPERLLRQVRPETIRILSATAAAEPTASTPACLEAGPFGDADVARAQAAVQVALPVGSWVSVKTDRPGTWIVYLGPYANREALNRKVEELKRRKLAYEEVEEGTPALLPGLVPGLALGRFDERSRAVRALNQLADQGLQAARVVELVAASSTHVLRVEKADAALAGKLAALKSEALGAGFVACASVPGN